MAKPPIGPLNEKLKILKGPMKSWSREHFDHLDEKINNLETAIHDLEMLSDDRMLNDMEKARLLQLNLFSNLVKSEGRESGGKKLDPMAFK